MIDELFEARRKKLEDAVRAAALALFEHMGAAAAFRIELDTGLYVIAGPRAGIHTLSQPDGPL